MSKMSALEAARVHTHSLRVRVFLAPGGFHRLNFPPHPFAVNQLAAFSQPVAFLDGLARLKHIVIVSGHGILGMRASVPRTLVAARSNSFFSVSGVRFTSMLSAPSLRIREYQAARLALPNSLW
jgi:hypothetical protein